MFDQFTMIFSITFLVVAALVVLIGALMGRRKIWALGFMRLIATAISAVVSVIFSVFFSGFITEKLGGFLLNSSLLGDVGATLQKIPSVVEMAGALLAMAIAPAMFLSMFFILRWILYAIVKPIARGTVSAERKAEIQADAELKTKRKKKKAMLRAKGFNFMGLVCGGASAFLVLVVLLIPVAGYGGIADDALDAAAALVPHEAVQTAHEIVEALDESTGISTIRTLGGKAVFS